MIYEDWPLLCFGCWADISRSDAHLCCHAFRCGDCHRAHEAEDDALMAILSGADD